MHSVEIGAGLCGIGLATNEAGILDELFLGAMLENWLDANWTIEIHDLFDKKGNVFSRGLLTNKLNANYNSNSYIVSY